MSISRRSFVAGSAIALLGGKARAAAGPETPPAARRRAGLDPWLEVEAAALEHNARTVARLAGGRPVFAVTKNNAYGCGISIVGPVLDRLDTIRGFGVVRAEEARQLRGAGVKKPVLLMGPFADDEVDELVRADVRLAPGSASDAPRLTALARRIGRPIAVHLYVDSGMHRMGMPHEQVLQWLDEPGLRNAIRIEGAFTELTEDQEFDRQQVARLSGVAGAARAKGLSLGLLHAASSDAVARPTPESFLDAIRPGLALYGGYVTPEAMARAELRPAYRLKARVIRVDRLGAGEGVSYHRRYTARQAEWTATLAIGHVDGYPTGAVRGCEVLVRGRLCPVVGTVSASHTVVALGAEASAQVGDEATLVGPDRPELHPNVVAQRSGWSEYNMFMHLNPGLARQLI